jgi:HlyD family secretion protein
MKKFLLTLMLLAVVAGSLGAYRQLTRPDEETAFSYLAVTRGDVVESVDATGTLQALNNVMVGSQVSGRVAALYADFNSIVRQGQVVAELDPSLVETQVEQARAGLIRAQSDRDRLTVTLADARIKLTRARSLFDRGTTTPQDLETAQSAVLMAEASLKSSEASIVQAQASLKQVEVNLERTVIRSPIDGIVVSRNVDVGQTVAASMNAPTIFVIAGDLTKMQVIANVDESDVGRMRPNQVVRFRVDAYPGEEFMGSVAQVRLNPIVSQNVVTYATAIDVPNPQLKLKPGMTAKVTVEIAKRTDVLRVPNGVLRYRPTADVFAELKLPVPADLRAVANLQDATLAPQQTGAKADLPAARGLVAIANAKPGAATIDQLFGALPETVTRGRAWIHIGGQLRPIQLRLGVTDGTWTELLGGELQEDQPLVLSIVTPAMAAAAASRPGNRPGQGQQGRNANPFSGGGGGGHGGGGAH